VRAALQSDPCRNVRCIYLNNPALSRGEFLEMLANRFEFGVEAARSKTVLLEQIDRTLRERRSRGEITALVIDEAQSLSLELLEEIRLLANIETPSEKLLPLVLAGQPELSDRLNDPVLRQLKQRVALRCELTPLDLAETAAYIASRIRTAGGQASKLFTREAVVLIHEFSGGIPRTISVMCDNALLGGMALGRQPVDREIVSEVCRDFDLRGQGARPVETQGMARELGWTTGPAADSVAADDVAEPEEPTEGDSPRRFLFGSHKG